jgi:hypothetical protein
MEAQYIKHEAGPKSSKTVEVPHLNIRGRRGELTLCENKLLTSLLL